MPQGTIIRACRDFCFIAEDNGPEVFAHRTRFADRNVLPAHVVGMRVEFSVTQTRKGPAADRVTILDDGKGREHGVIEKVFRDFGFIGEDAGAELFFHRTELSGNDWPEWDDLPGTRVTYTVSAPNKSGKYRAVAIRQES